MKSIIRGVKTIVNGFNDIINFIQTIFKLLGNLLSELVFLIRYLLNAVNLAASFVAHLPAWLKVYATTTIFICVLYVILGREGGEELMFLSYDITNFIDSFFSLMFTGVSNSLSTLDSITFHGFSLLDFSLALVLIGLGLQLFVNVVRVTGSQARADVGARMRK